MNQMTVRNRVKLARLEFSDLTQSEFAKQVGVTRQTMNLIEAQKYNPSIKVVLLISKVLGIPVDKLFWIENVDEEGVNEKDFLF